MAKLQSKLNRFFYRNRDKGIPHLMLVIAVASGIVYLSFLLNVEDPFVVRLLEFNREKILAGQLWRLVTYPLTYLMDFYPFLGFLSLLFYVWAGRLLEQYWGTLKFNLFYFSGMLFTDVAALIFHADAEATFISMSLFLALATLMPDEQIRIWFVLPVKMKWLAWIDLVLTGISVVNGIIAMIYALSHGQGLYLGWVLSIVPLLNYFLFFGRKSANLLPDFLRYHPTRKSWKRQMKTATVYNVQPRDNARFRCTVCGRTELSNPGLEFRYCSRCAGYRCYCEDHIHNHTHITDGQ